MSRWLPEPGEERWLALAARLRGALPREVVSEQAGGWRATGPFARIALFILGVHAAGLLVGILGIGSGFMLLPAGVIAVMASEWLKQRKRLHASGIEEGLCLGGYLMIGYWMVSEFGVGADGYSIAMLAHVAAIVAIAGAGLRLLNPFLTTCAALVALHWLGTMQFARTIDASSGAGITALLIACAAAAIALAAGAREFLRPSFDRMLDWLVVVPPILAYAIHAAFAGSGAAATGRLATCGLLLAFGSASLVAGLRRRRHAPLLAGLACVAGLAIELRFAIGGPAEAWLVLGGLIVIAAGVMLERSLRQPRNGVTSARLTDREGPLDLLQTAGVAVLAQSGRTDAPTPATAHEGRFGGGGASGSF